MTVLGDLVASTDLDKLTTYYDNLHTRDRLATVKQIARVAAATGKDSVLSWCFTRGFTVPPKSVNLDFYHAACGGQSPAIFQCLLDHGFDLNAHESEYVGDALVEATMSGNVEFTRWLLEHGQSPNRHLTIYSGDLEAVTYAIAGPHASIEILQLLLEHGAELKGTGAAIAAAETGNVEALRLCLEHGVDIEEVVVWGVVVGGELKSMGTALYRACRTGMFDTAQILLDRGANGSAKDGGGMSCLAIARKRKHESIVGLLEQRGIRE